MYLETTDKILIYDGLSGVLNKKIQLHIEYEHNDRYTVVEIGYRYWVEMDDVQIIETDGIKTFDGISFKREGDVPRTYTLDKTTYAEMTTQLLPYIPQGYVGQKKNAWLAYTAAKNLMINNFKKNNPTMNNSSVILKIENTD